MKHEAVFGDQSLFDGCYDETASIVIATSNGRKFVAGEFTEYGIVEGDVKSDGLRIAMRRIIADPKRWTVEDKKAGRLPDVGCECWHCKSKSVKSVIAVTATHIVINANNSVGVAPRFLLHDEFMQYYMPIETPEEKAQRLREEWCSDALSSCSILSGMQRYELKRLGGYIEDIYDALLSGELTMPNKDGE